MPPAARARSSQSQELGTPSGSPTRAAATQYLSHHLLAPKAHQQEIGLEAAQNLIQGILREDAGILGCSPTPSLVHSPEVKK